jgi:hypothetical protein
MEPERRKHVLLAMLLVVLAVAGYRAWTTTSAVPLPTSNGTAGAAPARREAQQQSAGDAPDVRLEALEADRPKPGTGQRDLFRFKPKPPPPAPKPMVQPVAAVPTGPPPPPPPPPIPFKFIGLVESGPAKRLAVLSDGRGMPVYGREGDIIEGRYRILRIGAESIEMEHIDGRGRQTIRLSGS